MRNLYIIGARGLGREIYNMFETCKSLHDDIKCIGFLDDDTCALNGFEGYPPIISSVENYLPKENDVFICALGEPKWIKHYTSIIESKGGQFISLISPDAYISKNVKIGKGAIISRFAIISCDIAIGDHTYIGVFSDIGHDVLIGDCCHLGAYTFIGGRTKVCNGVTVHPRVNIIPSRRIGENAIIGAGSIVIRNVKDNTTVFGNPAKRIY